MSTKITFTVKAYGNGKLLQEQTVDTRPEAEKVASEFSAKYGEYSTCIEINW